MDVYSYMDYCSSTISKNSGTFLSYIAMDTFSHMLCNLCLVDLLPFWMIYWTRKTVWWIRQSIVQRRTKQFSKMTNGDYWNTRQFCCKSNLHANVFKTSQWNEKTVQWVSLTVPLKKNIENIKRTSLNLFSIRLVYSS